MSKAITGAALLAAAAGGLAILTGGLSFAGMMALSSTEMDVLGALALGGVSMEAAAIAGALSSNRGMAITTRQAAAYRQIVYGQQRVGGIMIYQSTTGSSNDQWNAVIVLAGHEIDSIQNLYLDGREVHWLGSGVGYSIRNGVGFGGIADNNTYTGPSGQQYNFGGTGHSGLYCEARYGDQLDGDVIGGLTANDPNWAADGHGNSPYVGGCAYIYLKIEYNTSLFPSFPEIRITVNGKHVYDPRTSTTGYSSNWALICSDVLTDTTFGLGDNTVNLAQLIAAANVCDEQVEVEAISTTESRYTTNWHYDTATGPGDVLAAMMPGAQGRLSRIGGEWYIWPAYWQGPSFSFDDNALIAAPSWKPYRSTRDLCNRVVGTYIAPSYPYNCVGNLYDSNGFYNGTISDSWPFAFQPTNYPEYACDTLHGYASDQYLNADGGRQLPKEICYQTVLSITQAQRCAKIALLRNRQQGSGTFEMALCAYKMQPCDVMLFTFPPMGWSEKMLEVVGTSFKIDSEDGQDGQKALSIHTTVNVIETESSVYEWSTEDELTVYDVPTTPTQLSQVPTPPTDMSLTSSLGTALVGLDGVVQPRVEVQWDTPLDIFVTQIQIQYQLINLDLGIGPWLTVGLVDLSQNSTFVGGVSSGQTYNFRIRSLRPGGQTSTWVELDGFTVSTVLTVLTQTALADLSLTSIAYSGGTAAIYGLPFIAVIGNQTLSVSPSNYPLSGLNQNHLYFVYYIDPTFSGGAVTAIATQNQADFLNKAGYFMIGSLVTAVYGGGTAATGPWYPSTYADRQNGAAFYVTNPMVPYTTAGLYSGQFAVLGSVYVPSVPETLGTDIIYSGFINALGATGICAGTSGLTLGFANQGYVTGAGGQFTVSISYDNGTTWAVVQTVAAPGSMTIAEVTGSMPAGTDMSQVQVEIAVSPVASGMTTNALSLELVYIIINASSYGGVHPIHISGGGS